MRSGAVTVAPVALQFAGQVLQLPLRETKFVGLIAEHGAGCALHGALQLLDLACDACLALGHWLEKSAAQQFRARGEFATGVALILLPQQIVELAMQAWFSAFAFLSHLAKRIQ